MGANIDFLSSTINAKPKMLNIGRFESFSAANRGSVQTDSINEWKQKRTNDPIKGQWICILRWSMSAIQTGLRWGSHSLLDLVVDIFTNATSKHITKKYLESSRIYFLWASQVKWLRTALCEQMFTYFNRFYFSEHF